MTDTTTRGTSPVTRKKKMSFGLSRISENRNLLDSFTLFRTKRDRGVLSISLSPSYRQYDSGNSPETTKGRSHSQDQMVIPKTKPFHSKTAPDRDIPAPPIEALLYRYSPALSKGKGSVGDATGRRDVSCSNSRQLHQVTQLHETLSHASGGLRRKRAPFPTGNFSPNKFDNTPVIRPLRRGKPVFIVFLSFSTKAWHPVCKLSISKMILNRLKQRRNKTLER